jgi:sugar lactone lactonase YvrE
MTVGKPAVTNIDAQLAFDARCTLGEGPVWDEESGALLWADILQSRVHRWEPESDRHGIIDTGSPVGAVALRSGGGLALALEDGFAQSDPGKDTVRLIAPVGSDDPDSRFNDGKCDPMGRFWAGTMTYDVTPGAGSLYRLETDMTVTEVLDRVTISNGLAWTSDQTTMYYIDTPTQRVDAFDYDPSTGTIGNRRTLVEIPTDAGAPDGMAIDEEDHLWVALWGGWAVHRYRPNGVLDRIVALPVALVTSCAFGGPDLSDLYITSARVELDQRALTKQLHAGSVFRCRPGVRGRRAHRFGG